MIELIQDSGWGIWPVLLFGLATLFVAARHLFVAPARGSLASFVGLASLTLLSGALGTAMGVKRSAQAITEVAASERWIFLIGLDESLGCMVTALVLTILGTMLVTAGHARRSGGGTAAATGVMGVGAR